jgi:hypothetical protein
MLNFENNPFMLGVVMLSVIYAEYRGALYIDLVSEVDKIKSQTLSTHRKMIKMQKYQCL